MRPVGLFGWLAIVASLSIIAIGYIIYAGAIWVGPLWIASLLGLVFLGVALWQGSTRWLLALLPFLLAPWAFLVFMLFFFTT